MSTPAVYFLFWAKCHLSKAFYLKKLWLKTQNRLFSPYHQIIPFEPLDRGPISLVLVEYKFVELRSSCACSTILCLCFLSFPGYFYHNRLALFHSIACLFYPCLSSTEKRHGLLGLRYFSSSLLGLVCLLGISSC